MRQEIGRYSIILVGLIAGFLSMPIWASASTTMGFDLDTGNAAILGYTGPYAHVEVNATSGTTATITFTSLTNAGNIYLLGDGGSVDVNVNADTWTLSNITGSNAGTGFDPGDPYTNGGAKNVNGFGLFNQTIDSFDGYTHSSDTISFELTNISGTWLDALLQPDASLVLAENANGALAAAHIFVTSSPADAANKALATGFAAGSGGGIPPIEVPEPGTIILLGSGIIGLGLCGRLRLRR